MITNRRPAANKLGNFSRQPITPAHFILVLRGLGNNGRIWAFAQKVLEGKKDLR
jgi:hypothetical protein